MTRQQVGTAKTHHQDHDDQIHHHNPHDMVTDGGHDDDHALSDCDQMILVPVRDIIAHSSPWVVHSFNFNPFSSLNWFANLNFLNVHHFFQNSDMIGTIKQGTD